MENHLWVLYFTSSKEVKKFRATEGEPDLICVHKRFVTKEECLNYEINFLKLVDAKNNSMFLNKSNGAKDFTGRPLTEESKQKISEANKGRKHTDLSKKKFSEGQKNRKPMTEKTKKKISEAGKGRTRTEDSKNKWRETCLELYGGGPRKGQEISEETRAKISKANTGKTRTARSNRKL